MHAMSAAPTWRVLGRHARHLTEGVASSEALHRKEKYRVRPGRGSRQPAGRDGEQAGQDGEGQAPAPGAARVGGARERAEAPSRGMRHRAAVWTSSRNVSARAGRRCKGSSRRGGTWHAPFEGTGAQRPRTHTWLMGMSLSGSTSSSDSVSATKRWRSFGCKGRQGNCLGAPRC